MVVRIRGSRLFSVRPAARRLHDIRRIGEPVQVDTDLMTARRNAGVQPGRDVDVQPIPETGLPVLVGGEQAELTLAPTLAHAVLVRSR